MKAELLSQLVEDRRNERAVVSCTNLVTGAQVLLYPLETTSAAAGSENSGADASEAVGSESDATLLRAARAALLNDRSQQVDGPEGRVFLHVHNTPLRMVLVGAVHVAQPLAKMARYAGFAVSIVDPRAVFNTEARFPGAAPFDFVHKKSLHTIRDDVPRQALGVLADPSPQFRIFRHG